MQNADRQNILGKRAREKQREQIRGEREVALVKRVNVGIQIIEEHILDTYAGEQLS